MKSDTKKEKWKIVHMKGKRYLLYNGNLIKIESPCDDQYIISKMFKIISKLTTNCNSSNECKELKVDCGCDKCKRKRKIIRMVKKIKTANPISKKLSRGQKYYRGRREPKKEDKEKDKDKEPTSKILTTTPTTNNLNTLKFLTDMNRLNEINRLNEVKRIENKRVLDNEQKLIEYKKTEKEDLEKELAKQKVLSANLDARRIKLEGDVTKLEGNILKLEGDKKDLEDVVIKLEVEVDDLRDEVSEYKNKIANYKLEIEALEVKIREYEKKLGDYEKEIILLDLENDENKKKGEIYMGTIEELQREIMNLNGEMLEILNLKKENEEIAKRLEQEIKDKERQIKAKDKEIVKNELKQEELKDLLVDANNKIEEAQDTIEVEKFMKKVDKLYNLEGVKNLIIEYDMGHRLKGKQNKPELLEILASSERAVKEMFQDPKQKTKPDQFTPPLTTLNPIQEPRPAPKPDRTIRPDPLGDIKAPSQKGKGESTKSNGLSNLQIDEYMKDYHKKGFKGTFAIDQISEIPINKSDKSFSFVMNTEPIRVSVGHWVSVLITPDTIEYYDSFGEDPPKNFMKNLKPLLKRYGDSESIYQLKINRTKFQKINTDNCGYFAIDFLLKRYKGESFKDATGFDIIEKSMKGEKDIKKLKNKIKDFSHIKLQ